MPPTYCTCGSLDLSDLSVHHALLASISNELESNRVCNPLLQWSVMKLTDLVNEIEGGRITYTQTHMVESSIYL